MTDSTGVTVHETEAVIDNGRFGTRTVRFETGRLARQAAGSAVAYLDGETMDWPRGHHQRDGDDSR